MAELSGCIEPCRYAHVWQKSRMLRMTGCPVQSSLQACYSHAERSVASACDCVALWPSAGCNALCPTLALLVNVPRVTHQTAIIRQAQYATKRRDIMDVP